MRSTVDLPQPDGPTSEHELAAPQVEVDAADGNGAVRPGLSDAAQLEHRAGRIRRGFHARLARTRCSIGVTGAIFGSMNLFVMIDAGRDLRIGRLDVVAERGVEVVDDLLHARGHHVAERLVGAVADDLEL